MRGLLLREGIFLWHHPAQWAYGIAMFLLAALMQVFALGDQPDLLKLVGLGLLWSLALLCILLNGGQAFERDQAEGVLEQLVVLKVSLSYLVLVRWLSLWVMVGLPFLVVLPLLSQLFYLNINPLKSGIYILGTLHITLYTILGASLTLGARRFSFLTLFVMVPLLIPVLIGLTLPDPTETTFLLMGAGLLLMAPLNVFMAARALAQQVQG